MSLTPTPIWDRHSILAEIKRRYGSIRQFAATTTKLTDTQVSAALAAPYPRVDRIIAQALGVPLCVLWPDRYGAQGHRISQRSSHASGKASPNRAPASDTGAAA